MVSCAIVEVNWHLPLTPLTMYKLTLTATLKQTGYTFWENHIQIIQIHWNPLLPRSGARRIRIHNGHFVDPEFYFRFFGGKIKKKKKKKQSRNGVGISYILHINYLILIYMTQFINYFTNSVWFGHTNMRKLRGR